MKLEQHPLSAAFPAMQESELGALVLDIETHGQREPGVLLDGMVLDGWHRYLACERVGVPFKAKDFDGEDAVGFVISKNLHRRHLTASQRAAAVVAATNWRPHGDQKSRSLPGRDRTAGEMAKAAEVSEATIEHAKAAERVGLGDDVRKGTVSAKAAAQVAGLPPAKREKAVKAIKEGKTPEAPKKPKVVVASPELEKLYSAVKAELVELQGKFADLLEEKADLADTARALEDKLTAFETTEPDEQQKEIMKLQKLVQRKDGEIERLRREKNTLNNKCNALIQQVKIEKRNAKRV